MTGYPQPAPVFADSDAQADIIGWARSEDEAFSIYLNFYHGTGTRCIDAAQVTREREDRGPVDGWIPVCVDT